MNGQAALDGFMNQYNISMQLSRVGGHMPAEARDGSAIDRYRCRISKEGRKLNVYVASAAEEGLPTPSDVLFMLILDASGCEMLKDYYGKHEQMCFSDSDGGASEFDDFWKEYRSRLEQTQKLRAFLGKNLFNELVVRFGFND